MNPVVSSTPADGLTTKDPGFGGPLVTIVTDDAAILLPLPLLLLTVIPWREKVSIALGGREFGAKTRFTGTVAPIVPASGCQEESRTKRVELELGPEDEATAFALTPPVVTP